jgi:hypothetical protein
VENDKADDVVKIEEEVEDAADAAVEAVKLVDDVTKLLEDEDTVEFGENLFWVTK